MDQSPEGKQAISEIYAEHGRDILSDSNDFDKINNKVYNQIEKWTKD